MRVVLVVDWHSERMGYSDNFLPKYLAKLGLDVHLISGNAQVYFNNPFYKTVLEPVLGPGRTKCGIEEVDGYTVHRIPLITIGRTVYLKGLIGKIKELRPDIVQSGEFQTLTTYQVAIAKRLYEFRFFVENHTHLCVFGSDNIVRNLKWFLYSKSIGKVLCNLIDMTFPISPDAEIITHKYYGIKKNKIKLISLGTDSSLFVPVNTSELIVKRNNLREKFGFEEDDIVCIYTGRIEHGKAPMVLANAIQELRDNFGLPIYGLFVGPCDPEYIEQIKDKNFCKIQDFVSVQDLPQFYQASDIAVWPKQESTSQLDAMACGLPIILSNKVFVNERIDGNGFTYNELDSNDLARVIKKLLDPNVRKILGQNGVQKVKDKFNWLFIAEQYKESYEKSMIK
jgi:glycosyltransferase involved in cell wall biosynthesis